MISAGYMYKKVVPSDWLSDVRDVYSLSPCVSENFADYINYWRHNGHWLFDSPEVMEDLSAKEGIDLSGMTLFYYEVYEREFSDNSNEWFMFMPESSFETNVCVPTEKRLEGYDVVTFSVGSSPECSPLSCNSLADEVPVNEHCLFNAFAEAKEAIERGFFQNAEPGPYRIFAVYSVMHVQPDYPAHVPR